MVKKQNVQLGMPYGTACNKLRKSLLFSLIKELNKNVCYQCGKIIESEDELSIEHKIPFIDSEDPKKLFFDLSNIAFSHLKCNIKAARRPISIKIKHEERAKKGLHNLCKLNEEQVLQIKELSKTMKGTDIAKLMGVSKHTIYRILQGKTFSYICG